MERGLIDIGALLEPIDMEKFDFIRLEGKEQWAVLMRPDNPFQERQVLFTSNLSTNSALMVQKGFAYSLVIEGFVPFWDKDKIIFRPLSPQLTTNSALAWKKQQPFNLAVTRFIQHMRCLLGIKEA